MEMAVMRKIVFFIIILLLCSGLAIAQDPGVFLKGNDLVVLHGEYNKANRGDPNTKYEFAYQYSGYILGVYDSHAEQFTLSQGVTRGQLEVTVGNYLKAHPENWHRPAAEIVLEALQEAFLKNNN